MAASRSLIRKKANMKLHRRRIKVQTASEFLNQCCYVHFKPRVILSA
jgi:hypothetical protein